MAKEYTFCIAKYTNRQRQINKWIDIIVVFLSLVSIVTYWLINWAPILGVLLWLTWKFTSSVFPCFKQNEEELVELDDLHTFYESYFNRLEQFWYLHETNMISKDVLMALFYREKESESNKKPRLNRLLKSINETDYKKSNEETDDYFQQVFNTKSDEEESLSTTK